MTAGHFTRIAVPADDFPARFETSAVLICIFISVHSRLLNKLTFHNQVYLWPQLNKQLIKFSRCLFFKNIKSNLSFFSRNLRFFFRKWSILPQEIIIRASLHSNMIQFWLGIITRYHNLPLKRKKLGFNCKINPQPVKERTKEGVNYIAGNAFLSYKFCPLKTTLFHLFTIRQILWQGKIL